jgi:predicted nucleic acid-binding protein
MKIYPDTSILISLILNEVRAPKVIERLQQLDSPLCLSEWTLHELHCALARAVLTGRISALDFGKVLDGALDFVSSIKLGGPLISIASYQLENIDSLIMIRPELGLRAADAFHLGIIWGLPEMMLLTSDSLLHAAALALQIDAELI